MGKKIKIFLASSIEDLKLDRTEIGDFFGTLNNIYFDRDICFYLVKCENYDKAIALGGKQSEYDREIRESDLVFFLFFRKVGDYTKHEFEVALESFKEKKRPKIVTYFKYVNSADEINDEVKVFMDILDGELRHYYNTYGHIDTLKLGILMQIKLMGLDSSEFKIKDGEVCLNNVPVVRTENIPIINENRELQALVQKKRELQVLKEERRIAYLNDPTEENDQASDEVKAELKKVSEQLTESENKTLAFMSTVAEMTSDGRVLTHRQKEALKLFNQGDYDGARAILSDEEREQELQRAKNKAISAKNEIQGYVNEDLLWIETERLRGISEECINNIDRKYNKLEKLVKEYALDVRDLAESYADTVSAYLGCDINIFFDTRLIAKAEEHIDRAIAHTKQVSEQSRGRRDALAMLFVNAGRFYRAVWRFDSQRGMELKEKALEYLSEGVSLYEMLESETPNHYTAELADAYFVLGNIYHICSDRENRERYCLKAIEKYEQLDRSVAKNRSALANAYNYVGDLYGGRDVNNKEAADKYFRKAIEIRQLLAEEDILTYGEELAETYVYLYIYLERNGDLDEAMSFLSKWLDVYRRLAEIDPQRYCENFYASCLEFAAIGKERSYFSPETVEAYVKEALKVYETLAEKDHALYDRMLASCYKDAGEFYFDEPEKAEYYYLKAADVWKRILAKSPEETPMYLAGVYERMGFVYRGREKGRKYREMALEVLEKCPVDPRCKNMIQRIKRDLSEESK